MTYYLITLPTGQMMTFVGGGLKQARPGFVTLTTPDGRELLTLPKAYVVPTNEQETEDRVRADLEHRRREMRRN